MKKIRCPKCGKSLASGTALCPECGAFIFQSEVPAQSCGEKLKTLFAKFPLKKPILIAAVVVAAVIAIALCWDWIPKPDDDSQLSSNPSTQATTPSSQATTPSSQATTPSSQATAPSGESTAPSDQTQPQDTQPNLNWVVTDSKKMSYEEFFSENRPYYHGGISTSWTANDGNQYTINNQLQILHNGTPVYTVPSADQPAPLDNLLGADGTIAYLTTDTSFYAVTLLTGTRKVLLECDKLLSVASYGTDVFYLFARTQEKIGIYRFYVPSRTLDLLYDDISTDTAMPWFYTYSGWTTGSSKDIVWRTLNPEMFALLKQETQNPDSSYRSIATVFTQLDEYWQDPPLVFFLEYGYHGCKLLQHFQEQSGIPALVDYYYNPVTKACTQKKLLVDDCWFGSGWGCSHEYVDGPTEIPPTVIAGQSVPIPGMTPPADEIVEQILQNPYAGNKVLSAVYQIYQPCYIHKNGEKVSDLPVKSEPSPLCRFAPHCAVYISTEETVVLVDLEGNSTQLYSSQHGPLTKLSYAYGKAVFLDGEFAVEIDLTNYTVRTLFSHPGISELYYDNPGELYFTATLGLTLDAYTYYTETDLLEDNLPRL